MQRQKMQSLTPVLIIHMIDVVNDVQHLPHVLNDTNGMFDDIGIDPPSVGEPFSRVSNVSNNDISSELKTVGEKDRREDSLQSQPPPISAPEEVDDKLRLHEAKLYDGKEFEGNKSDQCNTNGTSQFQRSRSNTVIDEDVE